MRPVIELIGIVLLPTAIGYALIMERAAGPLGGPAAAGAAADHRPGARRADRAAGRAAAPAACRAGRPGDPQRRAGQGHAAARRARRLPRSAPDRLPAAGGDPAAARRPCAAGRDLPRGGRPARARTGRPRGRHPLIMVRVLAVSDVVNPALDADVTGVRDAELILACGDLPFEYLGRLMNRLDVPLVFVPGNHDPDVSGYRVSRGGLTLRAGLPARPPWPDGAVNADGRVVDVAGLRIAGLGGSPRYRPGPNQYTDRQQGRRGRRLAARARLRRPRGATRSVDILLTHAPPRGVGDGPDPPHQGFPST